MAEEIKSNASNVDAYANSIENAVSAVDVGWLNGVDDDNTLAESGIYNSFYTLRDSFETFKQALMTDAGNLRAAAAAFEEADENAAESN